MQIYKLKINHNTCTGCNVCVVSCPINFNQLRKSSYLNAENAVILVKNGIAYPVYKEEREINCDGGENMQFSLPENSQEIKFLHSISHKEQIKSRK